MKEPSDSRKNIILFLAVLLVILPWINLSSLKSLFITSPESSLPRKSSINYRPNPELSFWERTMCIGFKRASGCPERGLHPTEETRKSMGLKETKGKVPKRQATMNLRDIAGAN